jgi:hypothetical protein
LTVFDAITLVRRYLASPPARPLSEHVRRENLLTELREGLCWQHWRPLLVALGAGYRPGARGRLTSQVEAPAESLRQWLRRKRSKVKGVPPEYVPGTGPAEHSARLSKIRAG